MNRIVTAAAMVLLLAGCEAPRKDYEASARCHELGHQVGTPAFEECVRNERAERMMRQQREEFERMKQDERDWKMRRY
ncbi:MAG: hypothetical protein SFW63_00505 [Alphaproteobacteria bacterium]|nr:hypothetical protein [Alphaproteobacteria bacterium]